MQVISNVSVIRSFNAQNSQTAIMNGWLEQYFKNMVDLGLGYAAYLILYSILPTLVLAGVVAYGGHIIFTNPASGTGWLVSYVLY